MAAVSLRAATDEVAGRDGALAETIGRIGSLKHSPRHAGGPFGALVQAIVFQQLAGRAAQAIHTRVRVTVGPTLTPETLTATTDTALRRAGLSANKLASLRDLAAKVSNGTVVLTRTSGRGDEELIERLTSVHGIGRWTAEMYLPFHLRRLDIWPVGDFGARQGYALIWHLEETSEPKKLEQLGERFRPCRRVAHYCWAALAEQRTQVLPAAH
jgi:DNA-3-methyladenine glycosylase II